MEPVQAIMPRLPDKFKAKWFRCLRCLPLAEHWVGKMGSVDLCACECRNISIILKMSENI